MILLCSVRRLPFGMQQLRRCQAEPLNRCVDPGPLFREKLLAFALEQEIARAGIDEHAAASFALDQLLFNQLLIALQNRERIDPIFGGDIAHGRQRIAFFEHAVEYHGDDTVTKLAVNRLAVIPLTIVHVHQVALPREAQVTALAATLVLYLTTTLNQLQVFF